MASLEERNALAEENMNLVYKMTQLLYDTCSIRESVAFDREDCVQVGMIGLLDAAQNFDAKKGVKFSTYACVCIKNRILSEYRSLFTQGQILQFLCCELRDDLQILDHSDAIRKSEELIALRQSVERCKKKGKDFELGFRLVLLHAQGIKYKDAAKILNLSYSNARRQVFLFRKQMEEEAFS